jgi:hypothetical protein
MDQGPGGERHQQHEAPAARVAGDPAWQSWHPRKLAGHHHFLIDAMFDATYFRDVLTREIRAAGGSPVVDIALSNGHVHRIRSIAGVTDGYVTFLVYTVRGDLSHERPRFASDAGEHDDSPRVAVSYDSIASVLLDPAADTVKGRPGFAGF